MIGDEPLVLQTNDANSRRWNTGRRCVKRGCTEPQTTEEGTRMEANKAYFMVRAQVLSERERAKFDQWYGMHHLPLAMDKLGADKGWRFWSRSDPSVHYAMYEFKGMATLRKRLDSPGFK